jgi:hypothetical protein
MASPAPSVKHTTYFQVYDHLFRDYQNKPITFVEIGILGGGSLFMWRKFFGPDARIIGIDLNPDAMKWQDYGFEIHIGDQSDPAFWREFSRKVGSVNILLDDGGHTFLQQATVALEAINLIEDGGLLVIEDTHTSYMRGFGPRKYSFMRLVYQFMDQINQRFHGFKCDLPQSGANKVWSIEVFESIVSFKVNRARAQLDSAEVFNRPEEERMHLPLDYRYQNEKAIPSTKSIRLGLPKLSKLIHTLLPQHMRRDGMKLRQVFKHAKI